MNPSLARRRAALSLAVSLAAALAVAAPRARAALPPADGQAATVQAYVGLRTLQARVLVLQRLGEAAAQQRQAVAGAEPAPGADAAARQRLLAALDTRAASGLRLQETLQADLERAETALAALTLRDRAALRVALAPGAGRLPQVAMDVPFHLPAALGAPAGLLPALQAAQAQAERAQRLLQAGELALRAVELRQQAGAESPLAVLEAYQQMVALADDVALAQGALALAWVELLPLAAPHLVPRTTAAATP